MNTQLKVESAIERSLGKVGGTGNERFEIRFWIRTEVNGRKAESRGTVVNVEKPTVADARKWMQEISMILSGYIFNNQWTAANAKEVNAVFPNLVNDAIAEDAQFHADFNSFA